MRFTGRERIPRQGAVILCSNHTNAMCDALMLLRADDRQKVFVARADMFRIPWLAKVCTFLKIMPIYRTRDGLGEVRHNDVIMDKAVQILADGVPFCIFPEGTHHASDGLLPLNKGIFRIAIQAAETLPADVPVYIVPMGIRYRDWFHLWDEVEVEISEPMDIRHLLREKGEEQTPAQLINTMREALTERLTTLAKRTPRPAVKHRGLRWTLLGLTAPLAAACAMATLPIWVGRLIVNKVVEDDAFRNTVQYGLQVLFFTLTLWTVIPFHWMLEEWLYQVRRLRPQA